jgi:hypothetical protein
MFMTLAPGEIFQHTHRYASVTTLHEGAVDLEMGGERRALRVGVPTPIDAHVAHAVINVGGSHAVFECGHIAPPASEIPNIVVSQPGGDPEGGGEDPPPDSAAGGEPPATQDSAEQHSEDPHDDPAEAAAEPSAQETASTAGADSASSEQPSGESSGEEA